MKDLKQMSSHERLSFLQTNADHIEDGSYFLSFGEEEMAQTKDDLSDAAMALSNKESEFDEIKAKYKAEITPFKKAYKTALQNLRTQGEMVQGKLYLFADQESKTMNYYDQHGDLIKSRRLRPEERQMTIMSGASKTA